MKNLCLLFVVVLITACNTRTSDFRTKIDLKGRWKFAIDSANIGELQQWYSTDLNDVIQLPGTTDLNKKGFKNTDTTIMQLNRRYKYEGIAWYRKTVPIPEEFKDKHIQLYIERTKNTKVWIDSQFVGSSQLLESPQIFDVSAYLPLGLHSITIQVNNDLKLTPYGNVHIYSDDTQTNWNGILGKIYLEASEKTYISDLQVYPDINKKVANVKLTIDNQLNLSNIKVELAVEKTINGSTTKLDTEIFEVETQPRLFLKYQFGDDCELWDEYKQPVYKLTATISNDEIKDSKTVTFGMRNFEVKGTQFAINGRITFLRGKHDAAVFPLTGFPPMNVEEWKKVFKIAQSYGINHYRFHSYCPPEAAFVAADQEGIYIQAELPFWGDLKSDTVVRRLTDEGMGVLKAYANHPSFVLFSPGNEIWGGHGNVEKMMTKLKAYDSRPLYAFGSNNCSGYIPPRAFCDFFVGAHIPDNGDGIIGDIRLTNAFVDAVNGGLLNTKTPSAKINFDYAISHMNIPVISHEVGQYQIYPDYNEIKKYTGVLEARNLEVFQQRLKKSGMGNMDSIFQQASGAWSALCYKAEMEAALRTKGMAGFQLLDLQDYPGQGTALVGILDAFMDSKNVVTSRGWKQSCNDVVVLLELPKFCYTNNEKLQADILVANYSNKEINNTLNWQICRTDGTVIDKGSSDLTITTGGLFTVGTLSRKLASIKKASRLNINLSIPNTEYSNTYPIWVYPSQTVVIPKNDITISEKLTFPVINKLQNGAKVLLFPQTEDIKDKSFAGLFPPDFWNYGMFKGISENAGKPYSPGTLGLLMNPKHPIFNSFPTDFYTNWQWFSIIKTSNSLILDHTTNDYFPIVQVIDNLERNHKLGMIFEFNVGKGKLLVCMSQLNKLKDKPEAVQLYKSILNYMKSDNFDPKTSITPEKLKILL